MVGNFHGIADIIPVDTASKMMIACAWNTAIDKYIYLYYIKVVPYTSGQI